MVILNPIIVEEFADLAPNFFNTAYFGPLPRRTRAAAVKSLERFANPVNFKYDDWRPLPDEGRAKFSRLLGVSADAISHHSSTSEVMSFLALGFPFKAGDKVALMEGDYPSDVLPWMVNEKRRGYQIERLSEDCFRDVDLLREKLPAATKVLNISHVMFNTGRMNPIREIGELCRERGILFVVDVSQSLGGVELKPAEIELCDVIAGASYKWMLGPYGHAFACWSTRAMKTVEHVHLSWQGSLGSRDGNILNYSIETTPGARRFDRGQAPNVTGLKALMQSLDLLYETGLANIEAHNKSLVTRFLKTFPRQRFQLITPEGEHANIICLRPKDGNSDALQASLVNKSIDASVREGNLRLSFHLFNTAEQIENLVRALS
jgi:cysteine desulfurase/selenocysteine lyase